MDKLVTIGSNPDGSPLQISARELTRQLHGQHPWIYPHQLKAKYNISDDMWPSVQGALYDDFRALHREVRKDELYILNIQVNEKLSKYALALPHGANVKLLKSLDEALTKGQQQEIERLTFIFVMEPTYRAQLLATRYNKVKIFQEFAYLIDASYFAYLRHNFAAAFMTILPVIEGVILRWAAEKKPKFTGKRMKFQEVVEFVRDTPRRNPLLAIPLFADIWAATCASILKNNFYKDTTKGLSADNFNRHLALHMIEDKEFCTPLNIARTFLLLDLLGSLYLAENNQTDTMEGMPSEEFDLYLTPYLSLVRTGKENLERKMIRHARYKSLIDAHDQLGEPAVYWPSHFMLPLRDLIKKAFHLTGAKKENS